MNASHAIEIAFAAAAVATVVTVLLARRSLARERGYREMLDQLPNTSLACFDRDLRLRIAVGEGLRDRDVDGMIGRSVAELVPDTPRSARLIDQYRATLAGEEQVFEYVDPDGGQVYTVRTTPLRRRGSIAGVIAVLENISRQRELSLQAAERRVVLDLMNEAYVATDSEGVVTGWNRAAERTFGWSSLEALGRPVTDLIVPPADVAEFRGILSRTWPGVPATGRFEIRTERDARGRDGRTFPIELAMTIVDGDSGTVVHGLMHDISNRRESERELQQHAGDLATLAEAVGELARSNVAGEARAAICRVASRMAEADAAALLEPDPSGTGLRTTGWEGADLGGELIRFTEAAGAVRAFGSREPFFSADARNDRAIRASYYRELDIASVYWVPVVQDGDAVGVIAIGWKDPVATLSPRLERLMLLIAAEAGVAIERASLLERLERLAHTDDLTGVINRRAWDVELEREVGRARRDGTPLAVAMLDLDHFKEYNDRHGHQAGDRVLREAASAWRAALRDTDLLARYGGEEFAVALPGCDLEEASGLVDRLRDATPAAQSCSAGLVGWDGIETADHLLGRADRALYEAKQSGRDRTIIA